MDELRCIPYDCLLCTPSLPCITPTLFLLTSTEAEELGSREIEIENKVFVIEVKANDQGHFVKILEVRTSGWNGREI